LFIRTAKIMDELRQLAVFFDTFWLNKKTSGNFLNLAW